MIVQCLYIDGIDIAQNAGKLIDLITGDLFKRNYNFKFATARLTNKKNTEKFKIKKILDIKCDNLLIDFENFGLFSEGIDGYRDYFRPFEFIGFNKYKQNAEVLVYGQFDIQNLKNFAVQVSQIYDRCAYIYDYPLSQSPMSYFNGVSFVGEDENYIKAGIQDSDRVARWRNSRYLANRIDIDLKPRDIFETNFWKMPIYEMLKDIGIIEDLGNLSSANSEKKDDNFNINIKERDINEAIMLMDQKRA